MATELKVLANGRYQLIEKIGKGAFGQIFKARDVIDLKDVAVKVVFRLKGNA